MTFRNPLDYECQPNETNPEVTVEYNLDRFLAYCMMTSFDVLHGDGTDNLKPDKSDVYWLRGSFLEMMSVIPEIVRLMMDESRDKNGWISYNGPRAASVLVPVKNSKKGYGMVFQWNFMRFKPATEEEGGEVWVELNWESNRPVAREVGDLAMWISADAVLGDDFEEKLREARDWNEKNKVTPKD